MREEVALKINLPESRVQVSFSREGAADFDVTSINRRFFSQVNAALT
jgi:hypothetical protein